MAQKILPLIIFSASVRIPRSTLTSLGVERLAALSGKRITSLEVRFPSDWDSYWETEEPPWVQIGVKVRRDHVDVEVFRRKDRIRKHTERSLLFRGIEMALSGGEEFKEDMYTEADREWYVAWLVKKILLKKEMKMRLKKERKLRRSSLKR